MLPLVTRGFFVMSLKDEMAADLAAMFSTDEHADTFTVTPPGANPTTFTAPGIFFEPFSAALEGMIAVEDAKPHALFMAEDIPNVTRGYMLTREGTDYYVTSREPQDDGRVVKLVLSEDE